MTVYWDTLEDFLGRETIDCSFCLKPVYEDIRNLRDELRKKTEDGNLRTGRFDFIFVSPREYTKELFVYNLLNDMPIAGNNDSFIPICPECRKTCPLFYCIYDSKNFDKIVFNPNTDFQLNGQTGEMLRLTIRNCLTVPRMLPDRQLFGITPALCCRDLKEFEISFRILVAMDNSIKQVLDQLQSKPFQPIYQEYVHFLWSRFPNYADRKSVHIGEYEKDGLFSSLHMEHTLSNSVSPKKLPFDVTSAEKLRVIKEIEIPIENFDPRKYLRDLNGKYAEFRKNRSAKQYFSADGHFFGRELIERIDGLYDFAFNGETR